MISYLFEDSHTLYVGLYGAGFCWILLSLLFFWEQAAWKRLQRAYKGRIASLEQDLDFWMDLANELARERKRSGRTISPSVFRDLLVHGFENDEGTEKVLRQFLVIADTCISKGRDDQ